MTQQFAVGDRVIYDAEPGDKLNGGKASGEIIAIVHHLALIRPDDADVSGILVTRRPMRDIQKETE